MDDIYQFKETVSTLNLQNSVNFIQIPMIPKLVQFQNSSHYAKQNRGLEMLIFNDFLGHLNHRESPSLLTSGLVIKGEKVIHQKSDWRECLPFGVHLSDNIRARKLRDISDWFGGHVTSDPGYRRVIVKNLYTGNQKSDIENGLKSEKGSFISKTFVSRWLAKHS